MESNDDVDDFHFTIRQKSKLQSKRRNKLSNKHRSKLQKAGVENNKGDCQQFSPVSCTLSRKNSRTDDIPDVVIVSDESNDNLKTVSEIFETTNDKQFESENNKNEENNLRREPLHDLVDQVIKHNDQARQLNNISSDQECKRKENRNLWLVRSNDKAVCLKKPGEGSTTSLETDVDNLESSYLKCNTSSNSSTGKNFTLKILEINSCENKKLEECNNEDTGILYSESSKHSRKLKSSPLSSSLIECGKFVESVGTGVPSIRKTDLEHKYQDTEDSQNSNPPIQEDIHNIEEGKEHKEIQNSPLCPGSRVRSLSLEHLNDCTSDDRQEGSSEIKCEINSEKNNTSRVLSVSHDDSEKLYSCPLCWKTFENSQPHTIHMKECAARHNLTTRQLLDALELQEKQSAERLALGLPDIPTARVLKKPAKKKTGSGNDINLQLALALSVSLQEAEEKEQLEEDECLIEAGLGQEVVEKQKTMLEKFGFTTSRPALPSSTGSRSKQGSKNKNRNKNTVLTQRTKEERERIITEKVGIILIGEENTPSSSNENVEFAENPMGIMNGVQKYKTKSNSLWNAVTSSCDEKQDHYVRELSNLISPCKVKAGEKIKHLSQVPCRNVTSTSAEIAANDKRHHASASPQRNELLGKDPECPSTESKTRQSLQSFFSGKDTNDKKLAETLINDWRAILNKKKMSDIKIVVKSEQEIPGHKLVFYARCRSILNDVIESGPEKSTSMLMWVDISYRAALAFLQFIYCGLTSKILRLDEKDMLAVKELAQRYRVTELVEHLRVMNKVRAKVNNQSSPNSLRFRKTSTTSTKSFNTLQGELTPEKTCQNDIQTTGFSQRHFESNMPLSKESSPLQEDKLSSCTPSKHCVSTYSNAIPSQENFIFPNLDKSNTSISSRSLKSARQSSESSYCNNNVICPEHNSTEEIVEVPTSPVSNKTKNENNRSSNSSQHTDRRASPDLFLEEENEENIEDTSNGLTQESNVDIHYLLRMFDICLTQNSQEGTSQQKTPVKLSLSSTVSQDKNSSSAQKNKSLFSAPVDECMNNSQVLSANRSKSSLEHSSKTNDSINETGNTNIEPHSSAEELQFKTKDTENSHFLNDSKAHEKDFDCIDFLENLISDSPSKTNNKSMEIGNKQASVDSKRRYSERDSSSESYRSIAKKVCRDGSENEFVNTSLQKIDPNQNELNYSKQDENNVIDTLDLTQNSDKSENSQHCSTLNHKNDCSYISESCTEHQENHLTTMQDDIYNNIESIGESQHLTDIEKTRVDIKDSESGTAIKETSATDKRLNQDDWDSFDEMCNASEPEIFSQSLNKLISSQSISSNSEKCSKRNSLLPISQKQISSYDLDPISPRKTNNQSSQKSTNKKNLLEDSLMACLNESILWRDENAPTLNTSAKDRKSALLQEHNKYYKTPTQQQKNFATQNVTPPANYSAMKTPELKKELNKYGLKPSLTKKQAKIMLRYIYDQLHPFITLSDSEDSTEGGDNGLPPSPFKIPDKNTHVPKSPAKKEKRLRSLIGSKGNRHPVSVRRSLASQIDSGSDCDELSSQGSSSSSTINIAEEMLVEDLEDFDKEILSGSQDVCTSDNLPSVVQSYITSNPELHQKVLLHEPIWIEEFLNDLKAKNYKFKMNHLMDYFDEQCITFRTLQGQKSRLRKRQRKEARKKKSPTKKKGKLSNSKSAASSTLNSPNSSSN